MKMLKRKSQSLRYLGWVLTVRSYLTSFFINYLSSEANSSTRKDVYGTCSEQPVASRKNVFLGKSKKKYRTWPSAAGP